MRFQDDIRLVFRTALPFFRKWTKIPDNYDELYQQALADMQQPDFRAIGQLVTVWGKNIQQNDKFPIIEQH